MARMYILNPSTNTVGLDAQSTAFGCFGVVNGVATVCQYIDNLQPNSYTWFDNASGLHAQTHPNSQPYSSWDWQSGYFQIQINQQLDTIVLAPWSGPGAADAEGGGARYVESTKTRGQKPGLGAEEHASAAV